MKVFLRAVFVFQSRIFDDWYKSEWFNLYTVFCSEHFYFFSILCLTGWKITWKASVFKFLSGLKGVFLIWSGLEWPNGKNKALCFKFIRCSVCNTWMSHTQQHLHLNISIIYNPVSDVSLLIGKAKLNKAGLMFFKLSCQWCIVTTSSGSKRSVYWN